MTTTPCEANPGNSGSIVTRPVLAQAQAMAMAMTMANPSRATMAGI